MGEFRVCLAAQRRRERRGMERRAWSVANFLAPFADKNTPPTIDKLLGRKSRAISADQFATAEDFLRASNKLLTSILDQQPRSDDDEEFLQ